MNGTVKVFAVAAMLTLAVSLFGAAERSVFTRLKVDVKLERPPVPSVNNSPRNLPRLIHDPQWLMVKATFHPQQPRESGPNSSTFIDGVKMSVRVLFPLSKTSSNAWGMFKGEQTFWTVCCDGKTHTAMMFIPPQLLQRYVYLADDFVFGHALQSGSLRVEVVFTDGSGRELGRGYHGVSGGADRHAETFEQLAKRVPQQYVIDGAIWEREATPWSCMPAEQFDLVKPADIKLPETPAPQHKGNKLRGPRERKVR